MADQVPNNGGNDLGSRITGVETDVRGLHGDFTGLKRMVEQGFDKIDSSFDEMRKSVAQTNRPNYMLVIAVLMLIGSVWGAAIKPLGNDIARIEVAKDKDRDILATAVLKADNRVQELEKDVAKLAIQHASLLTRVDEIGEFGSRITRDRLKELEVLERLRSEGKLK